MGIASTPAAAGHRARRHAGALAGAGILAVGLVTAPAPDVDGIRTEVLAVQFAAFTHPAAHPALPLIAGSANTERQPKLAESASAVTTYDTVEDLNGQYWIADVGSSIAAIPGLIVIGIPFVALLATGVVIGTALAAYDAVAATLGLPPRNGAANAAVVQSVGNNVDVAAVPDPLRLVSDKVAIADQAIAKPARAIREKMVGDLSAVDDPTARSLVKQARAGVKQAVQEPAGVLKPTIATKRPSARAGGTPVRDAVGKAGTPSRKSSTGSRTGSRRRPRTATRLFEVRLILPGTLCAVTERTLALIKPDGVERRLVGEILSRIERKGLTVAALELKNVSDDLARAHYAEHDGKPFFGSLLEFITGGPVVAAILEGPRAVAAFRQLAGGTDPVEKAVPGTIRGDLGLETQYNLVHGSDSVESAEREIALWFPGLS